jgi:hypothetical protein
MIATERGGGGGLGDEHGEGLKGGERTRLPVPPLLAPRQVSIPLPVPEQ